MTPNAKGEAAVAPRRRLLAVSGSLRAGSFSTAILKALATASASRADYDFADIGALPHFNQDLYVSPLPESVRIFRDLVTSADGLVISSSEFNHGVPGVLKNALDWASRPHNSSPLKAKPVLIITSSPAFTGGVRAQYQIRETVTSALARPVATPEIVVGSVGTKMSEGEFEDDATMQFALAGLEAMYAEIDRNRQPH
ncbi:NAD(P)H-dependent oxidoreductase (plasmid) [Polymorphobacter sp. PAMC 29334]|uniref:NADPH-dependent FMN reductase n=1 Tax=Polymorphobacter sp. PAMC 29334 TaxID=2862331 RepID=UPI001C66DBBB|nr:NADPH-dependent FMN reductase [Polymorphobacter sp. PAMC 29334]QYE37106.1 NAD(P)H-dependent oxidoreductase [Polymorphobacter sp. PAMC 29334]